jgi:O-antigen ligase
MKNSVLSQVSATMNVEKLVRFLWAATLFTLPVTSFRWFPFLGESTYVRPLAFFPLALLIPLLMVQAWQGRRTLWWGGSSIALGAFALAVLTATVFGVLHDPIPLRGQTYLGRAVRALGTLFIGIVFFVCAVWMNRNEHDLKFTVKWMLAGLCLDLAWSGLQAVTFYTGLLEKEMVTHWQLMFSMRELVRTNRISGLAYEPAWLAAQLSMLYLPWLMAALLTRTRLTQGKCLEPILLALSLLVLLATYSRSGILTTLAAGGLTFMLAGRQSMHAAWDWFIRGFRHGAPAWLVRVGMIAAVVGALAGALYFLGQKDYFRRLWEIDAENLGEYIIDINAGARGAYSVGALAAFEEHPWMGVGLGASGFYIYRNLPDWALTTVSEIARQLNPQSRLYPNPKNMYVRLLAETGLIGSVLYLAFLLSLLGDALLALRRPEAWARFAGVAGLFTWLAIAFYNFTQDSLATPNLWILPGILAGLSQVWPFNSPNKEAS